MKSRFDAIFYESLSMRGEGVSSYRDIVSMNGESFSKCAELFTIISEMISRG